MAFDASVAVDVAEAVDAVDRKIRTLEACALRRLPSGSSLPPVAASRSFPSVRALYNAVDSAMLRLEKTAASLPRVATEGRSHIQASLIDYDPGELFLKRLEAPLNQLLGAAKVISGLAEYGAVSAIVFSQTELLAESIRAEASLISKAAKMAKPQNPAVLKEKCEPLVDASTEVSELKYEVEVKSPLHNHVMALADAAAALGWVVSPTPLKHVRDYKNIVSGLAETILASYIDLGCNPVHSEFAEALTAVLKTTVEYVAEEHPAGLRWNYAQGATPLGYRRAERKVAKDAHPFGDFYRVIHGALARYYTASRELGGPLARQADSVVGVYTELAKAIETASNQKTPPGSGEPELRMLLMSVQHEINALDSLRSSVPDGYRYMDHLNVVFEFLSSMQWCTATINKMSPVSFIIDIQGVTNLYLDKLITSLVGPQQSLESYATRLHREWVQAVRDMSKELLEYVKTHHPNGLTFDSRRSRRSMDEINARRSVPAKIKDLRQKSTAQKWRRGRVRLRRGGKILQVDGWIKAATR